MPRHRTQRAKNKARVHGLDKRPPMKSKKTARIKNPTKLSFDEFMNSTTITTDNNEGGATERCDERPDNTSGQKQLLENENVQPGCSQIIMFKPVSIITVDRGNCWRCNI